MNNEIDVIEDANDLIVLVKAIQMTFEMMSSLPGELKSQVDSLLLNQLERLCVGSHELKLKVEKALCLE